MLNRNLIGVEDVGCLWIEGLNLTLLIILIIKWAVNSKILIKRIIKLKVLQLYLLLIRNLISKVNNLILKLNK